MIPVITKAEPAELIAALATSHVHTTLILLDRTFTFGARLSVELHPVIRIFIAIVDSVDPDFQAFAVHGHMCIFSTSDTKGLVTLRAFNIDYITSEALYRHCAVDTWTPLCARRELDVGLDEELMIALVKAIIKQLLK